MKIYRLFCLLLTACVLGGCLSIVNAEQVTNSSLISGCRGMDSAAPILGNTQLVENAEAVVLYELQTDTLMYAWNADAPIPPAGLVKILTALLVIENGNLTDAVTVQESVLDTISKDSRTSKLQADEVLTLEQLLYCILVEGSNDASAVAADHVAGSQDAFVAMMNQYAAQIGCTASVFKNVHGLHDNEQVSTARDIARILSAAMKNETFSQIFGASYYAVEKTNKSDERSLQSGNHLMHKELYEIYYDYRVTGGRTGADYRGLRSVAATAEYNGVQLISIVIGSKSEVTDYGYVKKIGGFDETSDLLDIAFDGYQTAHIFYDGQALKQYSVVNGICDVVVGPKVNISSVISVDPVSEPLIYRYSEINGALVAPIEKDQRIATVEVWSGGVCLAQADLFALNQVQVSYGQIEDHGNDLTFWKIALIVVILLVFLCGATLFVVRFYNLKNASKHKKNKTLHRRRGK